MAKKFYCIYVGDMKWLGMMKKWQAYYLAFHVWIVLRSAKSDKQISIKEEDNHGTASSNQYRR